MIRLVDCEVNLWKICISLQENLLTLNLIYHLESLLGTEECRFKGGSRHKVHHYEERIIFFINSFY